MQQVSKQLIKGLPRRIALMLLDCGLIVLCYWLAVMLRFDSGDAYRRVEILRAMAPMLLYVLPIYMIVFWFGGLYEIMWEYAGMRDLARLTCLSGLATGASWLCYYYALQTGEASRVVPVDKLSVVITLVLAFVFLHEKFTVHSLIGCILIGAGTLLMVL